MINLHKAIGIVFIILWIICKESGALLPEPRVNARVNGLTYSQDDLLQLRSSMPYGIQAPILPGEIRRRKRGRRGGVQTRVRKRPHRPPLPTIILANVRSLRKQMDELHAKCQVERTFKEACIISVTESFLDETVADSEVHLDGFTLFRADRTRAEVSLCT